MSNKQDAHIDPAVLEKALQEFPKQSVLVLGDVFVDEYLTGDTGRISPEAPVPILHVKQTHRTLGGAANTAANIASLGGKAILIGLVGNDEASAIFISLAKSKGLEFHAITDGRPTIRKTRIVGQRQQLLRLDHEETHPVTQAGSEEILRAYRKRLPEAGIVVLSDYAKGFFTEALCQSIIREAKVMGRKVIVDPRPQHGRFYVGCDYLTPNWKESQGLLGQIESDALPEMVSRNGETLREHISANVILTLGPKGMAFFAQDGSSFTMPTMAREVFDVSGAGDTVVAAFALAKAAGCADRDAVAIANRAAGIVVGKLGTATLTPEELLGMGLADNRLVERRDLAPLSRHLRSLGKRIVTLNGSFDLLHAGHLKILADARRQGDILIVGLNSDASVKRYKGESRPIIPQGYRAEMLLAIRDVDYVHIFDEDVPMPFLEEIAPDVHVNGSEYGKDCIESPTILRLGGRIHIVEKIPGLSTSDIVSKLGGNKS